MVLGCVLDQPDINTIFSVFNVPFLYDMQHAHQVLHLKKNFHYFNETLNLIVIWLLAFAVHHQTLTQ